MFRFVKVFGLWYLFSIVGLAAVLSGAWFLVVVGPNSFITPFVVLGLASVFPVSLAVADNMVPRDNRLASPSVLCPHCGVSIGHGFGPKPNPGSWTEL